MTSRLCPARLGAVATLVVGACVLGWSLSISAGSNLFYVATLVLAWVWVAGSLLTRRCLPRGAPRQHAPSDVRGDLVIGALVGAALVLVFLAGALVLAHVPVLRAPVEDLLDHADRGLFLLVLALTMLNGVAEEMFFRGALYDVLTGWRPIVTSTFVYTVVTAASGIWMLALAGLVLGAVVAVLRRRTGGITAPIATHLVWQLGMIFLLPPAINLWS